MQKLRVMCMKSLAMMMSIVMILALLVSMVPVRAQEDTNLVDKGEEQFKPVKLFFKPGNSLDAIPLTEQDKDDHMKTCPDGFVGSGLFGHGIIKRIGTVEWMKVGRWETEPMGSTVTIKSPIYYVIYVSSKSTTSGDFAFNLLINGRYVNPNKDPNNWTQAKSVRITDSPVEIRVREMKINLSNTPINGGDKLGIEVWCRLQGDVKLHYGSYKYQSRMEVYANSIVSRGFKATEKTIKFIYSDAFAVPLQLMQTHIYIDGFEIQSQPQPSFEGGYPAAEWNLPMKLDPGPHDIAIAIAYDKQTNNTFYFTGTITIPVKEAKLDLVGIGATIGGIIILVLLAVAIYRWWENKQLEKFLMEEGWPPEQSGMG